MENVTLPGESLSGSSSTQSIFKRPKKELKHLTT